MKQHRRLAHELPVVTSGGWRYHHMGIPSDVQRADEEYIAEYKLYVSGFERSPYGIEWMRFEDDSPVSELVKRVPHVAFVVDNLEEAVRGKKLLGKVSTPCEGVRVAMIEDNGAPVELMEFDEPVDR